LQAGDGIFDVAVALLRLILALLGLYPPYSLRCCSWNMLKLGKGLMCCRMGLLDGASVVVGVPMLTSVGNLRFWLQLCRSSGLPGAEEILQQFKGESSDKARFAEFTRAYNADLVRKVGIDSNWISNPAMTWRCLCLTDAFPSHPIRLSSIHRTCVASSEITSTARRLVLP